jgi:hypothetical protein
VHTLKHSYVYNDIQASWSMWEEGNMFQPIFRVVSKHLLLDDPQSHQVRRWFLGPSPQVISLVFLPSQRDTPWIQVLWEDGFCLPWKIAYETFWHGSAARHSHISQKLAFGNKSVCLYRYWMFDPWVFQGTWKCAASMEWRWLDADLESQGLH